MARREEYKNLSQAEASRLAGAIWIYGGIHISGTNPRIIITMPIPLVYQYKEEVGGHVYQGEDGYFTLQIAEQLLVKKRLEEIQPFMSGEEAIQIRLALEIIRTKESGLPRQKLVEKIEELIEDWKRSRNRLKRWIEEFVAGHKDERKGGIPRGIWNKAYDWSHFMEKSGYERIPKMVAK